MTSSFPPPEVSIGPLLGQLHWQLAVAESCTGGLLSHRLTNTPGASAYYLGGVCTYADRSKQQVLGVTELTLREYGAVSRRTVLEMAAGVRALFAAEVGIAISGIAGPDGGTPEKPVGTTWIALISPRGEVAWRSQWTGDRLAVKEQSAQAALEYLLAHLQAATR